MRIVIAPQGFKGSLGPWAAARAILRGTQNVFPTAETVLIPVADGGNGTLEVLIGEDPRNYIKANVSGPLDEMVDASWGLMPDKMTAVIESAQACGMTLISPHRRNPLKTTSRGVGELIQLALGRGLRHIFLGVGGTATNDGGVGMAQALGVRFLDTNGDELTPGGGSLVNLKSIDFHDIDPRIAESEIELALDVSNPLCGAEGASVVYGPQKGGDIEAVNLLEKGLENLAMVVEYELGIDIRNFPGSGAGGGLGAGLSGFLGAKTKRGGQLVCEILDVRSCLVGADLAIVGEGSLDYQTQFGKAPIVVAGHAESLSVPVLGIAGSLGIGHEILHQHGIGWMASITGLGISDDVAMKCANHLVARVTEDALSKLDYFPN